MAKKKIVKEEVKEQEVNLTDIFDFSIAGYTKPLMQESKPYYTKVMRGIKNLKGKVYLMSPEDYIDNSFAISDIKAEEIRNPSIDILRPVIKFALPVLDTVNQKGLGRGRALLCMRAGIKEIPVLVCGDAESYFKEKKIKARIYV